MPGFCITDRLAILQKNGEGTGTAQMENRPARPAGAASGSGVGPEVSAYTAVDEARVNQRMRARIQPGSRAGRPTG